MDNNRDKKLNNKFVKEHYDAQISSLRGSYTDDRWHSSAVREFEYKQTARALRKALSGGTYKKALEIGPGDGVWTGMIREFVTGELYLVEQSTEMLERARTRLSQFSNVKFERNDFLAANPPSGNDLIIAVRCFEYFEDKEGALRKMKALLAPGGRIIIVTKNPKLLTLSSVQHQTLHSEQVSRSEMNNLISRAGLMLESVYPAVLRLKASWLSMRILFGMLQRIAVFTRGIFTVPLVNTYATESYVYVISHVR